MIKFKTLKYKHVLEAERLLALINEGKITRQEADAFTFEMVEDWDYTDVETGEPLPAGQPDELSIDQYNEVMLEFEKAMEGNTVKKTNELQSPSGSTESNQASKENLIPLNG